MPPHRRAGRPVPLPDAHGPALRWGARALRRAGYEVEARVPWRRRARRRRRADAAVVPVVVIGREGSATRAGSSSTGVTSGRGCDASSRAPRSERARPAPLGRGRRRPRSSISISSPPGQRRVDATTRALPRRTGSRRRRRGSASRRSRPCWRRRRSPPRGRAACRPRRPRPSAPISPAAAASTTSACSIPSRPSSHTVSRAPWSSGRASHASTRTGRRSASAAMTPSPVPRPEAARQPSCSGSSR